MMRLVGKVKDAHGLRGELYVLIFSGDTSWLGSLKKFGLGPLPHHQPGRGAAAGVTPSLPESELRIFPLARAKNHRDGLVVKAEGIEDRNASEALKGRGFYIDEELLVSSEGEGIYLGEILEFLLVDPAGRELGRVVAFSSNGPQDLLVVDTGRGRVDVPFVEAFLRGIDFEAKRVVMDLPAGLLEME